MRSFLLAAVTIILLPWSSSAKEAPVVSLSSEPTGLTVKSKSGKKIVPGIDIYSDGAVAVRRYDGSEARKGIDTSALETLLDRLERTRFYNITEDSFDAEFDASRRPGEWSKMFITDCPIWTLQIRQAGRTRSTKFYGLWDLAEHYPRSKELKRLKNAFMMVYSAVGEKPF
jgi:hypothetical protein